ncbi:MAG TPA: M23 family metallopeptidase [Candidatus Limnocylindria bacterium]|nr:M23 family metallopeptidase [Candidatus Limnocylindria bacterium]
MATKTRRSHATPSLTLIARRTARRTGASLLILTERAKIELIDVATRRVPATLSDYVGAKGLRLVLNVATASLVLVLPYAAAASARVAATPTDSLPIVASIAADDVTRAQTAARGVIAGTRSPTTVAAEDARPIVHRSIVKDDTLSSMANYYDLSLDALAYANGITEEDEILSIGQDLIIPPGEGALYVVKDGDTVEAVASRFKVDPSVIRSYNRLYFEPEHFATGQMIFVPGAVLPVLKRTERPLMIATPSNATLPARTGRLGWPVNGILTQYFWWGHTGVDIAAPYGTTLGASDAGVVVATGWVPVGGLRVCVQHSGGLQTCYYHTGAVFVTPGQTVQRGQAIASIGMTGVTTGPHVHWELKVNGVAVNPLNY